MIKTAFPLPVDERAIRALTSRLETIKISNGYNIEVNRVRRLLTAAQIDQIKEPPEVHVIPGHAIAGISEMTEVIYQRSSMFEWWMSVPVTILFYAKVPRVGMSAEVIYRLFKADILRAVLSSPIADTNNVEYPVSVRPTIDADGNERYPILCVPLYSTDNNEYAAGAVQLTLLSTFSANSPYLASQGDTFIMGP